MNASSLVSHPEESHYASTADPSGDVAVKESGEFVRTAREFLAPVADLIELLVHDGISQSHHHHFSISAGGQAKRGNNGDAFIGFNHGDLGIKQVDDSPSTWCDTRFCTMFVYHPLYGTAWRQADQRLPLHGRPGGGRPGG